MLNSYKHSFFFFFWLVCFIYAFMKHLTRNYAHKYLFYAVPLKSDIDILQINLDLTFQWRLDFSPFSLDYVLIKPFKCAWLCFLKIKYSFQGLDLIYVFAPLLYQVYLFFGLIKAESSKLLTKVRKMGNC